MADHGAPHVTIRYAYGSALCTTCPWKFSGEDEYASPGISQRPVSEIEHAAEEHARQHRHEVSLMVTTHTTLDYRIIRSIT